MASSPRAEAVAGGFKARFPCWFERVLDHCLEGTIAHGRNPERPGLAVGFGDVHALGRPGRPGRVGTQLIDELPPGFGRLHQDPIHTGGSFTRVGLRDSAHARQPVGVAAQHELLERADGLPVARLCCPEDPLPQIADLAIDPAPVDAVPIGWSHGSVCSGLHPTFAVVGIPCSGLRVTHQVHVSPLSGGQCPIQPVMTSRCLSAAGLRFLDLPVPLED